jgi:hypothetical protein
MMGDHDVCTARLFSLQWLALHFIALCMGRWSAWAGEARMLLSVCKVMGGTQDLDSSAMHRSADDSSTCPLCKSHENAFVVTTVAHLISKVSSILQSFFHALHRGEFC